MKDEDQPPVDDITADAEPDDQAKAAAGAEMNDASDADISSASETEADTEADTEAEAEPTEEAELSEEDLAAQARSEQIRRDELRRCIEAVVLVTQDPVEPQVLAGIAEASVEEVEAICDELADWYTEHDRGFQLVRIAGGYRFQTHPEQAPYVERFVLDGQSSRLSAAALESLAIVAYKQPISRAQISAIRGVSVDGVMRTLQQRGYIEEVARDEGPGQAVLYGTTGAFLERLGLDELAELPSLGEYVPSPEMVEALEQGLRIEADPVVTANEPIQLPLPEGTTTGDDAGESTDPFDTAGESTTDELAEVIDLTEARGADSSDPTDRPTDASGAGAAAFDALDVDLDE